LELKSTQDDVRLLTAEMLISLERPVMLVYWSYWGQALLGFEFTDPSIFRAVFPKSDVIIFVI